MELEGGSLLEDGGVKRVKQEAHFQPSFCQAVLAWRFSLLLLCNCLCLGCLVLLALFSLGDFGMFEVLSSKVSRQPSQPVPTSNAMAISHTYVTTSPLSAISHSTAATLPELGELRPARPARPAISHSTPAPSAHIAGRPDPSSIPNATLSTTPWVVHRFAKAGVSPHMCLQCLMVGGLFMPVLELQVEYARRHGYDLYTYTDESEQPDESHAIHFWKMRSTQYLIESGTTGCDYIFWMDSDAIIMNMSFSLENLIHWDGMEDTDIVLAADTLAANLAQSLWKFSRFTHQILEDSWNMGSFAPLVETGAFNAILGGCQPESSPEEKRACYKKMDRWKNRAFAQEYFYSGNNSKIKEVVVNKSLLPHVKWVPKRAINSYPFGYYGGQHHWGDPDFIVHCPSTRGKTEAWWLWIQHFSYLLICICTFSYFLYVAGRTGRDSLLTSS